MVEFFRHCPGCGRRFHIKLESKKLVSIDREPIPRIDRYGRAGMAQILQEGPPIILDIEDFQYTYKCGHCGHEWTEKKTKEEKEEHHLSAEPIPFYGKERYSDELWGEKYSGEPVAESPPPNEDKKN